MQDSWILAQAIDYTRSSSQPLASALAIFDSIRSPYYLRMYEHLDQQAKNFQRAQIESPEWSFEESLKVKVKGFGGGNTNSLSWIYGLDIKEVWEEFIRTNKYN